MDVGLRAIPRCSVISVAPLKITNYILAQYQIAKRPFIEAFSTRASFTDPRYNASFVIHLINGRRYVRTFQRSLASSDDRFADIVVNEILLQMNKP